TRHPKLRVAKQRQPEPGLDVKTDPVPDIGLDSYRGAGRLTGRKALITGGDSGIGAAVAIAYAREGADVAIAYLPQEQPDADRVL
ncbi:NAD(P)-dependent dehydrogenase, partial [Xanthomonas citri pv. citri]|nr:NAD(P)-dependent dehydrogenase [Xanthomonas citri pv. citri]